MYKTIVVLLSVLLMTTCAIAQNNSLDLIVTDNYYNGRYVTEMMKTDIGKPIIHDYIRGILEAVNSVRPQVIRKYYLNANYNEIIEEVILYFQNNPTKRHRPVVEVVLSGCK